MACDQQADFIVNRPVLEVFGHLTTLPRIAGIKVDRVDPQRYQISLTNGMSAFSWGENITISFYDAMNSTTRIIAHSRCKMPTQIMDGGRNRNNVESIRQFIISMYNR